MAITDIQISEELETNVPSIKYRGNEGPKSPQEMKMMMASVDDPFYRSGDEDEHSFRMFGKPYKELNADELEEFREEMMRLINKFSGGQPLPEDPTKPVNPFAPKPTGPVLPNRQMAAYGGIMGVDGRRQYGIGSFFQKYIKDPIERSIRGVDQSVLDEESRQRVAREDAMYGEGYEGFFDRLFKGEKYEGEDGETKRKESLSSAIAKNIVPIVGGIAAGLFTKNTENDTPGLPSDTTALALDDLKKSANILDQKQGMAAGLNFLPTVASRKYTPAEMIETYKTAAANGGRIGFNQGLLAGPSAGQQMKINSTNKPIIKNYYSKENSGRRNEAFFEVIDPMTGKMSTISEVDFYEKFGKPNAYGGRIGRAEGGIMDLGGLEKDYRAEGGFVPIGKEEKADDVPARLSVNEFVFTADAVRNAGGGDIDRGAQVMENMMKHLEAGGQVSEESQGMAGARDMFEVSERLSEVV